MTGALDAPAAWLRTARAAGRSALDEPSAKRLLAAFGLRVPASAVLAPDRADFAQAAAGLRPPYALKIVSPQVLHKSDIGGVRTGLPDAASVARAAGDIAASVARHGVVPEGWLLEEMAPAGQELVIGGLHDPQFGPLVMAGLGGVFVEVYADVAFRVCPIDADDAHDMLGELRAAPLLRGARGRPGVDEGSIVAALLAVGGVDGAMVRFGDEIAELDVNPLIATPAGAVAVDARILLAQR